MKIYQWFALSVVLAIFVCQPISAAAKDVWIRVQSKNFNLVGNASEKDIRKVGTKLEQFRETFRQIFNQVSFASPISTNVIVFKSAGAYKPFLPLRAGKADTGIAGYFQPGEDVNYITLSTEGEGDGGFETIFHEYVHFIVNTNFGKSEIPPWFNEGLAEYYETFQIEDDQKVKLGLPQSNHLQILQQTKLVPLSTLFSISNYALHQNGNHSRTIFYAESWALIHYLIQSGKSAGLSKFLLLSLKDVPSEKAFQDSFQMTYAQMEKELSKYVAQSTYQYNQVTLNKKLTFDDEMQTFPITEADSNAYLGDLLYHSNRPDDAEPYLQKALALAPDSSMANTSYGMVKMRQKKFAEAKSYLEKAAASDRTNHLAFYSYAYLLSREDRDDLGYMSVYPAEKAAKMRELLKKSIAAKPDFTNSYDLLAFVDLVNNEQLDEAIVYLQKALKYEPGNQQYAMRIAEIYLRQQKFAEAQAIADKVAKTADEPQLKSQAEHLAGEVQQMRENFAEQEKMRRQYETARMQTAVAGKDPMLVRNTNDGIKTVSAEDTAKENEENESRWVNQSLRKPQADEKQIIAHIQSIDCKGKNITYAVKSNGESFVLYSKDFLGLTTSAYSSDAANVEIGCGAKIAELNTVLTYKPQTDSKNAYRGELLVIEFVPKAFHLLTVAELEKDLAPSPTENIPTIDDSGNRRQAIMQSIRRDLQKPQTGEKQKVATLDKTECSSAGVVFYFKTPSQILKLSTNSPQTLKIRAFTPEIGALQFGCAMKPIEIPAVVTYRENSDPKSSLKGEILSLEFVPKDFNLEK